MKPKIIVTYLLLLCSLVFLDSCGSLKPAVINRYGSLDGYKYVYISPTSSTVGSTGSVVGGNYGVFGSTETSSINPGEVISGYFLKLGYVRLPELKQELLSQTIVVNFGISGRRNLNLGFTQEVTIQILSAQDSKIICVCSAEGQGETEADDIRIATNRCLNAIFTEKK